MNYIEHSPLAAHLFLHFYIIFSKHLAVQDMILDLAKGSRGQGTTWAFIHLPLLHSCQFMGFLTGLGNSFFSFYSSFNCFCKWINNWFVVWYDYCPGWTVSSFVVSLHPAFLVLTQSGLVMDSKALGVEMLECLKQPTKLDSLPWMWAGKDE